MYIYLYLSYMHIYIYICIYIYIYVHIYSHIKQMQINKYSKLVFTLNYTERVSRFLQQRKLFIILIILI